MQDYIFYLFIISFGGLMYYISQMESNNLVGVISTFDNKMYYVQDKEDKQEASDLMAKIKEQLVKLVDILEERKTEKISEEEKTSIDRILYKFDPNNIIENDGDERYTSYSINKGEKIVLCLRTRDEKNKLMDLNTMMFVAIHELAHIQAIGIGHGDEFWSLFKYLLKIATDNNIYHYENYDEKPKKYCGMVITDNPLSNDQIRAAF